MGKDSVRHEPYSLRPQLRDAMMTFVGSRTGVGVPKPNGSGAEAFQSKNCLAALVFVSRIMTGVLKNESMLGEPGLAAAEH